MELKILAVGDVVGDPGTSYLENGRRLSRIASQTGADLVIVNGENSAEGDGMLPSSTESLLDSGADVITGGNHTWQRREIFDYLDEHETVLRPANYPPSIPGHGYVIIDVKGVRVLVFNLTGNAFMDPVSPPFDAADRLLDKLAGQYDVAVLDFHAEATSEKIAMAWHLDGRVQVLFGTHTHVQTADARVFPGGLGYITDLGMTGSENGVIGADKDAVLRRFREKLPTRLNGARGNESAHGALFTVDTVTKKCLACEALTF